MTKIKNYQLSYGAKLACIYSSIISIIVVILMGITYKKEIIRVREETVTQLQVNTEQAAENMNQILYLLRELSAELIKNPYIYSNIYDLAFINEMSYFYQNQLKQKLLPPILSSKLNLMKEVEEISLYSRGGGGLHISGYEPSLTNEHFREEEWYKEIGGIQNSWEMHIQGNKLILMRKVINLKDFSRVGLLKIEYSLATIRKKNLQSIVIENGYYEVRDEKGEILIMSREEKGISENDNYIILKGKLEEVSWEVVNYIPKKYIDNIVLRTYRKQIGILIISLLGANLCSFYISKRMTDNIKKLNKAMHRVQKGEIIEVHIQSNDEIEMLASSFNEMIRGLDESYRKIYQAEMKEKEAQMQALQAQINPHFFYNTMEIIDALCLCEQNELASEVVRGMSKNFRYAMHYRKEVTLKEELEHIEEYSKILNIRYPNRFRMSIEVDEELLKLRLPKLTLQPFVENAILHGALSADHEVNIRVSGQRLEEQYVRIVIQDDGAGMQEELKLKIKSIFEGQESQEEGTQFLGLSNIAKRLNYFYGSDQSMQVESELKEGTSISIYLREEIEL